MSRLERISFRPMEVSQITGIGLRKVEQAIATGELPSKKIGRSRVISEKSVRDWVGAQEGRDVAAAR